MKADSKEKVQHFAADNFLCFGKKSLEAVINFCIVNANRGKAIAEDSEEMQEIVSYIKSLGTKVPLVMYLLDTMKKISNKNNFLKKGSV